MLATESPLRRSTDKTVTLDVRADILEGREPFSKIMSAVAQLQPAQNLLLIAPFEPVPLFQVLAQRGFQHASSQTASGDWEVLFTPATEPQMDPGASPAPGQASDAGSISNDDFVEVDARGLEPPEPLIKILEALSALPPRARLLARTDRRPIHLYPRLAERGLTGESEEQPDGSFLTLIAGATRS